MKKFTDKCLEMIGNNIWSFQIRLVEFKNMVEFQKSLAREVNVVNVNRIMEKEHIAWERHVKESYIKDAIKDAPTLDAKTKRL